MTDNLDDTYKQVSEEELKQWEAGNLRGVRTAYAGVRTDQRGNLVREFTVQDDEFATASEKQEWEYINWHRRSHRSVPDARCKICVNETQFRQQNPDMVGKRVSAPKCRNCGHPAESHIQGQCPTS